MDDSLKEAIKKLTESIDAVDRSVVVCKERVSDLETKLAMQNFYTLPAGAVVDKEFCHTTHDELLTVVDKKQEDQRAFLWKIIWATWGVLLVIGALAYEVLR